MLSHTFTIYLLFLEGRSSGLGKAKGKLVEIEKYGSSNNFPYLGYYLFKHLKIKKGYFVNKSTLFVCQKNDTLHYTYKKILISFFTTRIL